MNYYHDFFLFEIKKTHINTCTIGSHLFICLFSTKFWISSKNNRDKKIVIGNYIRNTNRLLEEVEFNMFRNKLIA